MPEFSILVETTVTTSQNHKARLAVKADNEEEAKKIARWTATYNWNQIASKAVSIPEVTVDVVTATEQ